MSNDIRKNIYATMYKIMRTDETLRGLINKGRVSVIYYSPRGQEAIPAALSASLRPTDYITTTYRGIHDTIAKGADLGEVVAEIIGRATGTCKGKGGIMHLSDPRSGVMVTSGIVGGGPPIANGLALRAQMTDSDSVAVAYFGDGATNEGTFHEALNLASLWSLPVIFVCQNNHYGEYTPRLESMKVEHIADRAIAYAMPGVTVDGNDPDAMFAVGAEAVERARNGGGPTLIDAHTYRFQGHVYGIDTMDYIPKKEYDAAVAADPVPMYRKKLIVDGAATEDDLVALEADAEKVVADAIEFALNSPVPDPSDLYNDVYAEAVTR